MARSEEGRWTKWKHSHDDIMKKTMYTQDKKNEREDDEKYL